MQYAATVQSGYVRIALQDESLDENISSEVKMLAVRLIKEGARSMSFNLERCTQCDDSGLGALLIANRLCRNVGGRCVISDVQDAVMQRIHAYQLEAALTIVAHQADADALCLTT